MVPGQVLDQLEAAVVVDAGDPSDHAGLDEGGDVAVGARLREGPLASRISGIDSGRPASASVVTRARRTGV